jgi:hypothetical protein
MVSGLAKHFGTSELAADATVVCLDWTCRRTKTARHTD